MRKSRTCLIGVLEKGKTDNVAEVTFEEMLVENSSKLKKDTNPQIQEVR